MGNFKDGLSDVFSGLINKRNATNRSQVTHRRLSGAEMRSMYKSGLMSKVFRLKVGYALNNTLKFDTTEDSEIFNAKLLPLCKKSAKFMLGFGRGIIVVFNQGDDLTTPLKNPNLSNIKLRVFDGDMVTAQAPVTDLQDERYYKPKYYNVRGQNIHHTRVVDFTYFEPVETEKPDYKYGGISESELVYAQFVNDEIVQRATGSIVEKASTFIYKIKGYKELISRKKETGVVNYVSTCEDGRSIYGALITDAEDAVEVVSQSIADLDKVDNITLRRISMVTGIGMTDLIGEQPGGLNASGSDERANTQDTIKNLQSDYLLEPINQLAKIFGMGSISFKDEQMQSATQKVDHENKAVATAKMLWEMGEDATAYLNEKGVIPKNDWEEFWGEEKEVKEPPSQVLNGFFDSSESNGKGGYISLDVHKNDALIISEWLLSIGVQNPISANDMHVTLFYSRNGMKEVEPSDKKTFYADVVDGAETMGDPLSKWYAIAIALNSDDLSKRHNDIKLETGASHSYANYKAHISLKYKPTSEDVNKIKSAKFPLDVVRLVNESQKDID